MSRGHQASAFPQPQAPYHCEDQGDDSPPQVLEAHRAGPFHNALKNRHGARRVFLLTQVGANVHGNTVHCEGRSIGEHQIQAR